jgi:hypothetical protein
MLLRDGVAMLTGAVLVVDATRREKRINSAFCDVERLVPIFNDVQSCISGCLSNA